VELLGCESNRAMAVGRVVEDREGGLDLRQRQRQHAFGRDRVDCHSGSTEAMVEQDLNEGTTE
jgi:hypothetical protein